MDAQAHASQYASDAFDVDVAGKASKSTHARQVWTCRDTRDCLILDVVHLQFQWKVNWRHSTTTLPGETNAIHETPCHTLDILFAPISTFPQGLAVNSCAGATIRDSGSESGQQTYSTNTLSHLKPEERTSKALLFIQDAVRNNIQQYGFTIIAIKLLLPAVDGRVVRDDIIQRRFLNHPLAEKVADFASLQRPIRKFDPQAEDIFPRALSNAVGAVLLKGLPGPDRQLVEAGMSALEDDVTARLSFQWITDSPMPRKRLAIVGGRPHPVASAAAEGLLRAASALGIRLVILDQEGHWLQDPGNEHLRDEFLVCNLHLDEQLSGRIVNVLSKTTTSVDGIMTFSDEYLTATAVAAKILGLWTSSPETVEVCVNKRRTRELITPHIPHLCTTGAVDLKEKIESSPRALEYPIIIKPTVGFASNGVSKAGSEQALLEVVRRNEKTFPGNTFLLEPYMSGPEVDANFVLHDGEVVFAEVSDDFPSPAEIPQHTKDPSDTCSTLSFAETSIIMPSALPDAEISLLKTSLGEMLLSLGFQSGVFHVEARVNDSRKNYESNDSGMNLTADHSRAGRNKEPSVFLVEINARCPGHMGIYAVEYTYGIDYYALSMLQALSSASLASRLRSLSQPFPASIRYPTNVVFIPATRGGTFISAKPLPPVLMKYVPHFKVFMQKGAIIKDPEREGRWPFIAYFLVAATLTGMEGREQVRTLGDAIRDSFEYELV